MASVNVNITDRTVISALNTPGGAVYEWRDEIGRSIANRAFVRSPVNNPMNALHRGGRVGDYKRGWTTSRAGSNGHRVRTTVSNLSDHAIYVEFGRSASTKFQAFSWSKWGGDVRWVGRANRTNYRRAGSLQRGGGGTAARPGKHILRNATNLVLRQNGLAAL